MPRGARIQLEDNEVEAASLPLLSTSLARAVVKIAKMRRVDPRVIVEEAVFWYLNFISFRIENDGRVPINLSAATSDRIAQRLAELITDDLVDKIVEKLADKLDKK